MNHLKLFGSWLLSKNDVAWNVQSPEFLLAENETSATNLLLSIKLVATEFQTTFGS